MEDLLGGEKRHRGVDRTGDGAQRLLQRGQGHAPAADEGHDEGVAGQSPGAADALDVAGHRARQGGEHDGGQVADVDAHLQGRGGHQHVGGVRNISVGGLELLLGAQAHLLVQQAGVFPGDHGAGVPGGVEAAVVVGVDAHHLIGTQATGVQTGGTGEHRAHVRGHPEPGAAHPALECLRLLLGGHDDVLRAQVIDRGTGTGVHRAEHVAPGQLLHQGGDGRGGVVGGHAQGAGGPPGVGAAGAGGGHGRVDGLRGAVEHLAGAGEGGGAAPGESRHALGEGGTFVQVVGVAVVVQVRAEPRVGDTAVDAHRLDHTPGPGQGVRPVHGQGDAGQGGIGGGREHGVLHVHPGGQRAGGDQGAGQVGAVAELQGHVQRQAGGHLPGGPAALPGGGLRCPVGAVVGVVGDLRGQQFVAGAGIVLRRFHEPARQRGEGDGVLAHGLAQQGTQGEAARPGLHEAGAVGGVLHRVGEHQGLLLPVIQPVEAEEVGQRHRQQRGHRGSQVADGVALAAGGAGLGLGELVLVLPGVGEHGHHQAALQGLLGRLGGGQRRQSHVQPQHPAVAVAAAAEFAGAGAELEGGVDERALALGRGHRAAADGLRVDLGGVVAGLQGDHPPGAPAVTAVAGGQPGFGVRGILGGPVIGPAEHGVHGG